MHICIVLQEQSQSAGLIEDSLYFLFRQLCDLSSTKIGISYLFSLLFILFEWDYGNVSVKMLSQLGEFNRRWANLHKRIRISMEFHI